MLGSAQTVADQLGVHINTIRNRLHRAEEILGTDQASEKEQAAMTLAAFTWQRFHQIAKWSPCRFGMRREAAFLLIRSRGQEDPAASIHSHPHKAFGHSECCFSTLDTFTIVNASNIVYNITNLQFGRESEFSHSMQRRKLWKRCIRELGLPSQTH